MSFDEDPNEQANISAADLAQMIDEIHRVKTERADLLAALEDCISHVPVSGLLWHGREVMIKARAGIAKVKGGEELSPYTKGVHPQ